MSIFNLIEGISRSSEEAYSSAGHCLYGGSMVGFYCCWAFGCMTLYFGSERVKSVGGGIGSIVFYFD